MLRDLAAFPFETNAPWFKRFHKVYLVMPLVFTSQWTHLLSVFPFFVSFGDLWCIEAALRIGLAITACGEEQRESPLEPCGTSMIPIISLLPPVLPLQSS